MLQVPNFIPINLDYRKTNIKETVPIHATLNSPLTDNDQSLSYSNQNELWPKSSLNMAKKPIFFIETSVEEDISPMVNKDEAVFTYYYMAEKAMDKMTSLDAEEILCEFQKSQWSSKL